MVVILNTKATFSLVTVANVRLLITQDYLANAKEVTTGGGN